MPEHLYIGEQNYYSFFNNKPPVPDKEVWVLQSRTSSPVPIWGSGNTSALPASPLRPALPALLVNLLRPFTKRIYKFNRTAKLRAHLILFQHPTFQITMTADIQVSLIDPISYLESSLSNVQNNPLIKDALQTALQSALTLDPPKYNDYRVIPLTLYDLIPTKTDQTERQAAAAMNALQNHPALRTLGIRARILTHEMLFPAIFEDFVNAASRQLQPELQNVNELLIQQRVKKPSGVEYLEWKEHLYTTIAQYYQEARNTIEAILTELLDKISGFSTDRSDPQLAASIFKILVEQLIDVPIQNSSIHDSPMLNNPKNTEAAIYQEEPSRVTSTREMEIETLYIWAKDRHWSIAPSLNNVKGVILIDLTESCQVILQIPQTYPNTQPVVKITYNNAPVKQSEINSLLQPTIGKQQYDLYEIVSRVALHFAEAIKDTQ